MDKKENEKMREKNNQKKSSAKKKIIEKFKQKLNKNFKQKFILFTHLNETHRLLYTYSSSLID